MSIIAKTRTLQHLYVENVLLKTGVANLKHGSTILQVAHTVNFVKDAFKVFKIAD